MSQIKEIKELLKTDKLVLGTARVIKGLKAGSIKKVYVSSNCPEDVFESISHYAELGKAELMKLDMPNDELGIVCKKMFSISVLGIKV